MKYLILPLVLSAVHISFPEPVKALEPITSHTFDFQSVSTSSPSGILDYTFEPNPQQISPKMYNWTVKLNQADSQNGRYEIIQITHPIQGGKKVGQAKQRVLISDDMVRTNEDGQIHFVLHVGDKSPTVNANGPGNLGHSIIFSGRGTGTGASNAIILPGSNVLRVTPASQGRQLSGDQLHLIQFVVTNANDEMFQVDVMLHRK